MDSFLRLNRSKKLFGAACVLLFLFMLALNCLTPYVSDDFVYRISFATKTPVTNIGDVVRSMYVHCFAMNGRVVSHFFGQTFMLWPKLVFNTCNALIYTALMVLLYRAANYHRERNLLLFAAICAAFWYYMPVFGQVAVWQIGSVNYLWGLLGGMVYLCPFLVKAVSQRELLPRVWQRVLFCVFAVLFGMYTEVTSFIMIFLACLLLAAAPLTKRGSWRSWLWVPAALGAVGYLILMTMPAEIAAKQAAMTLATLLENFKRSTIALQTNGKELLIAWVVLFVLSLYAKLPADRLLLSLLFAMGAVAANYMLIMASYYPDRCFCTTAMLLILAIGVLAADLSFSRFSAVCACGGSVLALLCAFSVVFGVLDIEHTHRAFRQREAIIEELIAAGERDLEIPLVYAATKYSAFYGLQDVDTQERYDTWPNPEMSMYYGVDSVLGVP